MTCDQYLILIISWSLFNFSENTAEKIYKIWILIDDRERHNLIFFDSKLDAGNYFALFLYHQAIMLYIYKTHVNYGYTSGSICLISFMCSIPQMRKYKDFNSEAVMINTICLLNLKSDKN